MVYKFTQEQYSEIHKLLEKRLLENKEDKRKTRSKIRKLGFNISDHFNGFSEKDFENLLKSGNIQFVTNNVITKIDLSKKTSKENNFQKSYKESLQPLVNLNTEILIVGTMPGEKSLELQQYYSNKSNQFWKIIFQIFNNGVSIEAYSDKEKFLLENKIGLWDTLSHCNRIGSLDSAIKNHTLNNFEDFLKKYPKIKLLLFNGKDSFNYFESLKSVKNLTLVQLSSTSSMNTSKTLEEKILEWKSALKKKYQLT